MAKAKLLPKIVFKNKPENEMLIGAYVEPLVYGRYIKDHGVKVTIEQAYDDLRDCNESIGMPQQRAENPIEISYYEIMLQNNKSYFIKGQTEEEALNTLIQAYPEALKYAVKSIRTLPRENYEQLKQYASQRPKEAIKI